MSRTLVVLSMLLQVLACQVSAEIRSCPAIDCDCDAITGESWRELCFKGEQIIVAECVKNQGVPQNYCRMQGPDAFPTPLSVKPRSQAVEPLTAQQPADVVDKLITTQYWSLAEDLANLKGRAVDDSLVEALKISKILDRNVEKLFQLQLSVQDSIARLNKSADVRKYFKGYAESSAALADNILTQRDTGEVAGTVGGAGDVEIRRHLRGQLSRSAAALYEQVAYLWAHSGADKDAALAWQKAAAIAEKLAEEEELGQNDPKYVNFYREQASARWHKATYYWVKGKDAEQALSTNRQAANALLPSTAQAPDNAGEQNPRSAGATAQPEAKQ